MPVVRIEEPWSRLLNETPNRLLQQTPLLPKPLGSKGQYYSMKKRQSHLAEWKWTEIWLLALTSIIVLASRLPWITAGPGTDPDSFRVFNAAKNLIESGVYSYSRPPGYPLHEYLVAALVRFGPTGTNMLSAAFSMIAFLFFALVLRRSGVRAFLLAALGFAFTPVIYINSISTIDYVPAIAPVMAATYFTLSRRFVIAGVSLGLAIGFRITSGAMLVPLILWIVLDAEKDRGVRRSFQLLTTTLAVALICFAPVFMEYGSRFFTFCDNRGYPSLQFLLYKGVLSVWGFLGSLALAGLCCSVLFSAREITAKLALRRTLPLLLLAGVAVLLYVVAFLRLPLEAGYLVPVVPFTIMVLALLLPTTSIRILAFALILSSFVGTLHRSGIALYGPVQRDYQQRVAEQEYTRDVIAAVETIPKDAIVVVGYHLPAITTQLQSTGHGVGQYVYLISDHSALAKYQSEGRQVYFLPGMNDYNKSIHGIDLLNYGAQQLDPLDEE